MHRPLRAHLAAATLLISLAACTAVSPGAGSPSPSASPTATSDAASPSSPPSPAAPSVDATVAAGLALVRPVDGVEQLFVIDPDGSARQLTGLADGGAPAAARPIWSPDRSMIAFAPPARGAGLDPQLWIVNADGSGARAVGDVGETTNWSPDSTRLLFMDSVWTTDNSGLPPRLWLLEVASGELTELRIGATPQWLPDGERYSYQRVDGGVQPDLPRLQVVGLDGGASRELPPGSGGWWSPDGTAVLLRRDDGLYIAGAEDGEARGLVAGDSPAWSPDGRLVAYAHVDEVGTFMVGVVDREGQVRWSGVPGSNPTWSPDGTMLAIEVGIAEVSTQILDAATGRVIWELEGRHPAW
jgi:Tol biopolymer transport system component